MNREMNKSIKKLISYNIFFDYKFVFILLKSLFKSYILFIYNTVLLFDFLKYKG